MVSEGYTVMNSIPLPQCMDAINDFGQILLLIQISQLKDESLDVVLEQSQIGKTD